MRGNRFSITGLLVVATMSSVSQASPSICLGDGNGDGVVDFGDITVVLGNWLSDYTPGTGPGDTNGDGLVDFGDITAALGNWLRICPLYEGDASPRAPGEAELTIPEYSSCGGALLETRASQWIYGTHLFSGEFHHREIDFRIKGRGFDFVWARRYRSQACPNSGMGNRWDFSYNIYAEGGQSGDIVLHNGNGRAIPFELQMDGTWIAQGYFRQIVDTMPGYEVRMPTGAKWILSALDGSPTAGKIEMIVDRNGNSMTFGYDGTGNLITITDTLNRVQTIAWINIPGVGDRVDYVEDHTLRRWRYTYALVDGPLGDAGTLLEAHSPVVVGTPTLNDFPNGRTTTYTYVGELTGDQLAQEGEEFRDLLKTIEDGREIVWLRNEYHLGGDPSTEAARLRQQTWGDPGDVINLVYQPGQPQASNNFADLLVFLNDRRGAVKELFFSSVNDAVMCHEYTGFADPDLETTDFVNRPMTKLRATDPDFFETRVTYNADHQPVLIENPEGDSTQFVYDDLNLDPRARGNKLSQTQLPGPRAAAQASRTQSWIYLSTFGGCGCSPQFVTSHTDFRGHTITHMYDPNGNRTLTEERVPGDVRSWTHNVYGQVLTHTHPDNGNAYQRVDRFDYYGPGPQWGYLEQKVDDVNGFALTTSYEYDNRGNVVRQIDPRLNDTLSTYNQLDERVRVESAAVMTSNGPVRYGRDIFYDENDNVVRRDVDNIDGDGTPNANAVITTTYDYDILNRQVRMTQEVAPGHNIVTEYDFDANRNQTVTRLGQATNGMQPTNTLTTLHDERDLVFQWIRGDGSPEQSTDQYNYDGNGNIVTSAQGLEGTPRITNYSFDGYDRMTSSTDPMGNITSTVYDANSNPVATRLDGEMLDVAGSVANIRLAEISKVYDEMDRITESHEAHFVTDTQAAIGDGLSSSTAVWSHASQVLSVTNDNGHTRTVAYDTALRASIETDAAGNTVEYQYDQNGNVTSVTTMELSDLGNPAQQFVETSVFDELNRRVSVSDNLGDTTTDTFDSRNNVVECIDALGNRILAVFDGVNRLVSTTRELTDTGDGDGILVGTITTQQSWDDSSRLVSKTDGKGNPTNYIYDALDRVVQSHCSDGTVNASVFDVHDNETQSTDPNGTTVERQHDLLNRVTVSQVQVLGAGISNDVLLEQSAYDGLSRIVSATDEDSTVEREIDSLSNIIEERQNGVIVLCSFDGVGNNVVCDYPDGRQINRTFDVLERPSSIDGRVRNLATIKYIGPDRVERVDYGNGTRIDYEYNGVVGVPNLPGDFGFRRISRTTHSFGATIIDDRAYRFDPMQNRISRDDLDPLGPQHQHLYEYDSAYRLRRGEVLDQKAVTVRDEQYTHDAVHNRTLVVGGANPGAYTLDGTVPPSDLQVNQYTATSFDSREYDENGNLITIDPAGPPLNLVRYDFRNRMVEFERTTTGVRTEYKYDVLGRRIVKIVDADGVNGSPVETRYIYDGWKVIEEQDGGGTTQTTFVYGLGVDHLITMRRPGLTDYYYHQDGNFNVMAISNAVGIAVERYDYADYGRPLDPGSLAPTPANPSTIGNPYYFTGRRFDPETEWYYYRMRHLDPKAGRFTSRDPIGMWGDPVNSGNATAFVGNSPWTLTDPMGQKADVWQIIDPNAGGFDELITFPNSPPRLKDLLPTNDCYRATSFDTRTLSEFEPQGSGAVFGDCRSTPSKKATAFYTGLIDYKDCPGFIQDYVMFGTGKVPGCVNVYKVELIRETIDGRKEDILKRDRYAELPAIERPYFHLRGYTWFAEDPGLTSGSKLKNEPPRGLLIVFLDQNGNEASPTDYYPFTLSTIPLP